MMARVACRWMYRPTGVVGIRQFEKACVGGRR